MIRISVPCHGSVPTNRTLSSTGPLSVQLKRSYRLHASIKAYFVEKKSSRTPELLEVSILRHNLNEAFLGKSAKFKTIAVLL